MTHEEDPEEQPAEDAIRQERLAIRKRSMDFLARRKHAYDELVTKLKKREHLADDIQIVLDQLMDDGLQSNRRYAEAIVESKANRGIGPVRIRKELAGVGVSEHDIAIALDEAGVDWHANAEAVRIKRFGAELPPDFAAKAKQMRFLQQRGFDFDQLQAAFDD